jgi:hypothetical protein
MAAAGRLTGKIESTEATTDTRGLGGVVVKPQGEVEKLEGVQETQR